MVHLLLLEQLVAGWPEAPSIAPMVRTDLHESAVTVVFEEVANDGLLEAPRRVNTRLRADRYRRPGHAEGLRERGEAQVEAAKLVAEDTRKGHAEK